MYTVKLHFNRLLGTGLKGPSYPKSVISKLGFGELTRLGICTVQLHWLPDSLHNCMALTPAVTVCLLKAGDC